MAAIILALLLLAGAQAQNQQTQLKSTGSCGRCHVASVLEWSVSKHQKSSTDCAACHGASQGHIVDERNNVKPERIPRGAAIAGLCLTCHTGGCPKSKEKATCQKCHHAHALLNPNSGKSLQDQRLNELESRWAAYSRSMQEGEGLMKQGLWQPARDAFRRAAQQRPGDTRAGQRILACERRMDPKLPGFEILGNEFDPETGLPARVRVNGSGIEMVLVPGGEADIGSDKLKSAAPVHTVQVQAFYLGKYEISQGQWKKLTGTNPSVSQGDRLPVENVSWNDCQALLKKLNETTPGAGFRLPAESEWEYAARAGSSQPAALSRVAWFHERAPRTSGSGEPNPWGLYDMLGNVWEWCSSANRPYPFDPSDGRESAGPAEHRILRGGGYADSADYLDPALRHSERPDRRYQWNGMRLARSVPAGIQR